MLHDIQCGKFADHVEQQPRGSHRKAPPRVFNAGCSDAMTCLPDQEQTNKRDKQPMAIIFAANPEAEQISKAVKKHVPQEGNGQGRAKDKRELACHKRMPIFIGSTAG